VTFTPDGKYVLLPDRMNDIRVYDSAARKQVASIPVAGNPGGIVVSPDGKQAFVACQGSNDVKVIDTATWKVTKVIAVGRGADGLAFQ
jgi:YVTN family beta-propeller protein